MANKNNPGALDANKMLQTSEAFFFKNKPAQPWQKDRNTLIRNNSIKLSTETELVMLDSQRLPTTSVEPTQPIWPTSTPVCATPTSTDGKPLRNFSMPIRPRQMPW